MTPIGRPHGVPVSKGLCGSGLGHWAKPWESQMLSMGMGLVATILSGPPVLKPVLSTHQYHLVFY